MAFAPGGEAALTAAHDTLVLWDTASGEAITYFTAPARVNAIALGPGGRLALLGLSDDTAVLFDARKGGIRRVFAHQGRVRSVALDADARLALSGGEDRSARLWDVESGASCSAGSTTPTCAWSRWRRTARARSASASTTARWCGTRRRGESSACCRRFARGSRAARPGPPRRSRPMAHGCSPVRPTGGSNYGICLRSSGGRQWEMPRRTDWKRSGAYILAVGFGAAEGACLSVSADGFVHRLRLTP